MYAVIRDHSRQTTVREGDVILCDLKRDLAQGDSVIFDEVLLVENEGQVVLGKPTVDGALVTGEVLGEEKGPKVIAMRFKRRKNVRVKRGHRRAEGLAARLEVGKLVERGAGRRQQDHRARATIAPRGVASPGHRGGEIAALRDRHAAFQRRGEAIRRLADQEGVGDARQKRFQRVEPFVLGPAAGDPVNIVVTG